MDRECPHPTCTTMIDRDVFACRTHWFRLPVAVRNRIYAAFRRFRRDPIGQVENLMNAQAEAERLWEGTP